MTGSTTSGNALTKSDLAIGTGITVAMAIAFITLSSGRSLLVTFVPGVIFAWLVFVWMYLAGTALPPADTFVPSFFAALAIQFLHFAEEFATDFKTLFPVLYGGTAYTNNLFVTFNMVSYAVFTLCCLLVFYKGVRFLLVPVLFYTMYGAIGNAITHTWWVVYSQAYFSGFYTALAYWIAGPWLLYKLLGSRRHAAVAVIAFSIALIPLVTIFMAK